MRKKLEECLIYLGALYVILVIINAIRYFFFS